MTSRCGCLCANLTNVILSVVLDVLLHLLKTYLADESLLAFYVKLCMCNTLMVHIPQVVQLVLYTQ